MVLAIDIGNTNIVVGCIQGEEIIFNERVSTNHTATDLEYAIKFKTIFEIHRIDPKAFDGMVMSSVVPALIEPVKQAIKKLADVEIVVVGPGIKTGLRILTDYPAQVGSDLVAGAVAAVTYYKAPLIVIDMGTATTMSVVDKDENYLGTSIIPGLKTSLDALTSGAAQLSKVKLQIPDRVVGKNTIECINNGTLHFTASGIDGMIDRIEDELGYKCTAVATGGLSGMVIPLCRKDIIYDDDLLLKGLITIYRKNKA